MSALLRQIRVALGSYVYRDHKIVCVCVSHRLAKGTTTEYITKEEVLQVQEAGEYRAVILRMMDLMASYGPGRDALALPGGCQGHMA